MSWLSSLGISMKPNSAGLADVEEVTGVSSETGASAKYDGVSEGNKPIKLGSPSREDLSEFTEPLSNKFWAVASLGPHPSSLTPSSSRRVDFSSFSSLSVRQERKDPTVSDDSDLGVPRQLPRTTGMLSDFAEISDAFKFGISRLSNKVNVNEISKIASSFLPLQKVDTNEYLEEEYEDDLLIRDVFGVTDEVLAFATNIACHPETWLDCPLLPEDESCDDFDVSEAQRDHALAIESLTPRLAALRIELCPTHMSLGSFWKIYFVLLHPRLNKHDAELLSTPQVVEARAMLLHGLQVQAKQEPGGFRRASSFKDDASSSSEQLSTPRMPASPTKAWLPLENVALQQNKYFDMDKHTILTSEVEFVDKYVVKEGPTILQTKVKDKALNEALDVEDDDEWPEDETLDVNVDGIAGMQFCNEEDISFSDLEDDAYPIKSSKSATHSAVEQ